MSIDPNRGHFQILRDSLEVLERYPPTRRDRQSYLECSVCGFTLLGEVASYEEEGHNTHINRITKQSCAYVRVVAELNAWLRVEEVLESERSLREWNGEPEPIPPAVLAERQRCADIVRAYAKPPAWIESNAAEGIAKAILGENSNE